MGTATLKQIVVAMVFVVVLFAFEHGRVTGAGECGRASSPDREAMKLAPCMSAAQVATAPVSSGCCAEVQKMGKSPACLCAAMNSNIAKAAGIKPEVAVTIPKRCNLEDRPVGYQCGSYTVP
ncbi:hypothetical protein MLD38_002652 [Melastoma candidum]|uniref:Uncharacterized protein n=1 Tax=Melastoma candidum TaxID=119954 RepID=A0ACB9S204_9MYRT|nr:hypothetical protein MLD38_002652 [Melastoma candidum]